jgi:hypothetical protein
MHAQKEGKAFIEESKEGSEEGEEGTEGEDCKEECQVASPNTSSGPVGCASRV